MVLSLTEGNNALNDLFENDEEQSGENGGEIFVSIVKRLLTQYMIMKQTSRGKLNGTDRNISYLSNSNGYIFWPLNDLPPTIQSIGTPYIFNITSNYQSTESNKYSVFVTWARNISEAGGINITILGSNAASLNSFSRIPDVSVTLWYFAPPSAI